MPFRFFHLGRKTQSSEIPLSYSSADSRLVGPSRPRTKNEKKKKQRGNILPFSAPTYYPRSTYGNTCVLLVCCAVTAATQGYDGAMMSGLNIMSQYNDYFDLTTATRSLNIATLYIGGAVSCLFWGWLTDEYGRRPALFYAAAITLLAAALQAAAQNNTMFNIARILIGFGTTASAITAPAYLAELLPWRQRAFGLALFSDLFYIGALIAAIVTYATATQLPNTSWAWRLPSLLQGAWALLCMALLPWMPESPRWLVDMGRHHEALVVLACVNAGGDVSNDLVRLQFREICDTIGYERAPMTVGQMLRNVGSRKRLLITASCAFFSMVQGETLTKYQLGKILDATGVVDKQAQLAIAMGLNGMSLLTSLLGSYFVARIGAKRTVLVSTAGLTVALYIVGPLTKVYGQTGYMPGIYANVAMLFLFSASYAFGWIPVLFLLPAEMLNFSIRAWGMSMFSFVICLAGVGGNFAFPFALEQIGWRLFIVNASWNVLAFVYIAWYWVEVKDKTLEEIDVLFDGVKHSDCPDLEMVLAGFADWQWKERLGQWMRLKFPVIAEDSMATR